MNHPLDRLFSPRSIVVVGGSDRPGSVGQVVLQNLREGGYAGELSVVNPKHRSVGGLVCRKSVRALPHAVDLALIAVPAAAVAEVIADCGAVGIGVAIVMSAGFGEQGEEGQQRQARLLEVAARAGVRLVGPNCLGLLRPSAALHAFFGLTRPRSGRLALVSQSGAVCTAILDWAEERQIGFSAVLSLGAAADIGFGEALDYLALDAETDAVLLHIEGVDHPRRFMSGLRAAARMKPVIALKTGRMPEGSRAAKSHTGALVGDDAVFESALHRAGAVRAATLDQLFSAAALLARGQRAHGGRLAVVTNAGGLGVMAADRAAERGLSLATLGEHTLRELDAALPAHWSHGNPIDLIGDAPPERYAKALTPVLSDPAVDGVLVLLSPQAMTDPIAVAAAVADARAGSAKPVLACFMGGRLVRDAKALLSRREVPELPTPEAAVDAFADLASFERNQRLLLEVPGALTDRRPPDLLAARTLVERVLREGRSVMSLSEAKQLLAAFHVAVTPSVLARSPEEAWSAVQRLSAPVAMKIDSPDITHKSDVGGVRLGLSTQAAVRDAFYEMTVEASKRRPGAAIRGVTIEPMHGKRTGRELLAGIAWDRAFGPTIVFGAGGTLVELMADRSLALPPLNRLIARDMIEHTRVRRLLGDFRGMPSVDVDAIETVLLRLSEIACELPEVQELDINPLIADASGVLAADARVVVRAVTRTADRHAHVAIAPYPGQLTRVLQLGEHHLTLRPIRPEDARMEQTFVRDLSSEARYFRFHRGLSQLTPLMLVRFTQLDYEREMAFVAVVERDGSELAVGVSRYVQDPDGQSCEFALVVADAWQGQGVGSALMDALADRARSMGIRRMHGEVLAANAKMLELVRDLGFDLKRHADDATLVTATLALDAEPRTSPAVAAQPG
jgi:acetyltransferase